MKNTVKNFSTSETIFEIPKLKEDIRQKEVEISQDSFWQENTQAQALLTSLSRLKNTVSSYDRLVTIQDDIKVFSEMAAEEGGDSESAEEAKMLLLTLVKQVDDLELTSLLSNKYDASNCIVSLNAGAGGTDAQDWAQILLRMYTRWFEKRGYTVDVVDEAMGDEAGIKSVTLMVSGDFAYGYLKNEIGVHRLVRLSPFNSNNKRQTSFAALDVVELDSKDLRVDTFRASGAGGQHVNKTDSAVRITHLPTGLVSQSQNSRSQSANRETAMKILKSRLLQLMEKEHKAMVKDLRGDSKDIAWGNQIRSYVFHPYKLIKDLRTGVERTDIQTVMDGDLDGFVWANLRKIAIA
ncbi:MAG: peptide chain release factor 2 [Candidatus Marinamargulisbacteria bacterium]